MNKKLPRILQPNVRLYFMLLIAFAIATFFIGDYNRLLAAIQVVILISVAVYSRIATRKRTAKLLDYLESISDSMDLTVRDTPLPVVVFDSGTGGILWVSDRFISDTNLHVPFYVQSIADVVPGFAWDWLLDGKNECQELVAAGEKKYKVFGNIVRSEREYFAMTYWFDVTEYERIKTEHSDSRLIFTILTLDNYEELLKGITEKEKSALLSNIDEKISAWAGDRGGYLCKFDRDRYFFLFEERHLDAYVKDNFSILDLVRTETGSGGVHATLCIGIGKDGSTPMENYRYASLGVEMALSRGGDQAVIKNRYGFEFFGGHSPQVEKRTKVKSRIMANAFVELLEDASKVYVMGHESSDFDSMGAALGICCMARAKRKPVHVITYMESSLVKNLVAHVSKLPEYRDVFISEQKAVLDADNKTLLVVVDTTRPNKVESKSLLLSCTRIAVVDHHRRAAEYIDNAVLNFHEPSASSTCELVTEMMQYLIGKEDILGVEAEALLAGIMLDTKGFVMNTASGTFDAAAFLSRMGADMTSIKSLLQSDFKIAADKYALMHRAVIYKDCIAFSSCDDPMDRISIAQAADELLSIKGVAASFVTARDSDNIFVSGRSVGKVNVQLILEKLGGGGSQSSAGLQVHGSSVKTVVGELKLAIDEYFESEKKA